VASDDCWIGAIAGIFRLELRHSIGIALGFLGAAMLIGEAFVVLCGCDPRIAGTGFLGVVLPFSTSMEG
jgi:hypothetical protein